MYRWECVRAYLYIMFTDFEAHVERATHIPHTHTQTHTHTHAHPRQKHTEGMMVVEVLVDYFSHPTTVADICDPYTATIAVLYVSDHDDHHVH